MARSVNNILTQGLKGMVGKQMVFRTWNGKTFISVAPRKPKKQSALQKENRGKFRKATAFAKSMMKDPVKKAEYAEIARKLKLPNAYTAAITDYMRNPEISEVDTTHYSGKANEKIRIWAKKKGFEIQEVEVTVVDGNGEIMEAGKAQQSPATDWVYRTKVDVKEKESIHIIIRAKDKAGNFIEKRC